MEELFRAHGDVPARWVPRRLILQNYWLYPYQEFHFGNGRLMLRGPNGSGKTSVLVSAVTLALDGEKSRSRLDPFGQSGRSIAYYLVGKTEAEEGGGALYHDDRTGYVALEFQHGGDGRFLTIGVGMRGRRLSGGGTPRVDSWGFVVRDGRRVGRDRALDLTTPEGVPLSRVELAEQVGPGGVVVERVSDYQAEVNRALFGFREEGDYAFLVQILLALRSPKLNKELKPSDVADILSESLPPLDPSLLERMTQIMDDIDATRADIESTAANHGWVGKIHLAAGRYANQVAQEGALEYRERHAGVEAVSDKLVDARERASAERGRREQSEIRLREVDHERADLRGRLKVLRNHEAYRSQDALTAGEKEVSRIREHHVATRAAVRDASGEVTELERQRSRLHDHWRQQHRMLGQGVQELSDAAREAAWPHAEQSASSLRAALAAVAALGFGRGDPPELRADAIAELAAERRQRLEDVLEALAGVARAETEVERTQTQVDQAQAALRDGHDELRAAREAVDHGRDALTVRLDRWRQELHELPISNADLAELRERIHGVDEPDDAGVMLFDPFFVLASRRRAQLDADREDARARISVLDVRRQEARTELEMWQARDEAVPQPRPGQDAARERLTAAGVAAVPLFQAAEVRQQLSDDDVRPLHSALHESGLLDALLVPCDDVEVARRALGPAGGDRWIRPFALPEGAATLADVLEPVPCGLPEADVMAALRSVALEVPSSGASTGVTADGLWRIGLLEGRPAAVTDDSPMYLRQQARVRERDRQVARFLNVVRELDEAAASARDEIHDLGERINRLDREVEILRALPEPGILARALAMRSDRVGRVEELNERFVAVERRMVAARRTVGEARRVHESMLRQAEGARGRDADGVLGLMEAGERVVTLATRVADRLETLRADDEQLARIEAARARHGLALDNARAREREAAESVAEAEGRVRAIETGLRDLGFDEIADEVHRGEERESELERDGRELVATIRALEGSIERTEADVTSLTDERTRGEAERVEAKARLAEAVRAYPTLGDAATIFGGGAVGEAGRAADHLLERREEGSTDLRRRISDDKARAFQALAQEVSESRSALIEYHPSLDSGTGEVSFRHEGRELPPYGLLDVLDRHRQRQMAVMREKEDELYEEFFLQEVSGRIREAIERAEESVARVNALLAERPLANDEILSLRWRPHKEIGADGADHPRLVELLRKPASVLPPEDERWIKTFFHERVRVVREDAADGPAREGREQASFAEALRGVLDYRRWFSFTIHAKPPSDSSAEVTNRTFATRSGGEKSLAMFVPLLAAVDARFQSAGADAPKLIGLDEAFAGVDTSNVNEMFAFMASLDLSWIMTSEKLWGVGAALPACTTYQFHRRGTLAAVEPWLWDGRRNVDGLRLTLPMNKREATEGKGSGAA